MTAETPPAAPAANAHTPLRDARVRAVLADGGWALAIIVGAALALRIFQLGTQLWLDEVLMLGELVRKPFGEMITSYRTDNQHPLYTALAWVSVRMFGEAAWALRLPAALFGTAAVAASFVFVRRVADRGIALLVAAVMAVWYHQIWFSQNARAYTALLFFALLSVGRWRDLWRGDRGALPWYAAWTALAAYSHLTGAFLAVGALLAWVVGRVRARTGWLPLAGIVLAGAGALALHGPMLGEMWHFFAGRPDRVAKASEWKSPLWTLTTLVQGLGARSLALAAVPGLIAVVALLHGMRRVARRDPGTVLAMILPGVVGAAVTLGLGRHLWPRFFVFQSTFVLWLGLEGVRPAFEAIVGRIAGAGARASWIKTTAATLVVVAGLVTARNVYETKQDFESPREYVRSHRAPDEPVFTAGLATWPYQYLYAPEFEPVQDAAEFEPALGRPSRAWLIYASEIFMKANRPAVWEVVASRFEVVQRWPSSLGEVVLCREKSER